MIGDLNEPVPAWVPLARELLARGVSVPLTVLAFDHYRIAGVAWGDAVATVAAATGKTVQGVAEEVIAVAAHPATAPTLERALFDLHAVLDQIPGLVRGAGMIPSAGALLRDWRGYANHRGLPLPCSLASAEWIPVMRLAHAAGMGIAELQRAAQRYQIRLQSGAVLDPLGPAATEDTVAEALSIPAVDQLRRLLEDVAAIGDARSAADRARKMPDTLRNLPGVAAIEERPWRGIGRPRFVPPPGTTSLDPPWLKFPEPIQSMRWRMGAGEDYLDLWYAFWRTISAEQREAYFARHAVPEAWRDWVARVQKDGES